MMVVTSVDVKFSKEYTASGVPLYGDFSITLQSLFSGSVLGDMTNMNSNLEKHLVQDLMENLQQE